MVVWRLINFRADSLSTNLCSCSSLDEKLEKSLFFFLERRSKEGRARLENACLIGLKSKCVAMQGDLLIAFKLRKSEVNVLLAP